MRTQLEDLKDDIENVILKHKEIIGSPVPDEKKISQVDTLMGNIRVHSKVCHFNNLFLTTKDVCPICQ